MAAAPLRIGDHFLRADDPVAIDAAVTTHNNRGRIPGLDDSLNPFLLDPAKVRAFIAALSAAAPAAGEAALYLNSPDLPLRPTSPVTAEAIAAARAITITETQGRTALIRAEIPVACAEAGRTAETARRALAIAALDPAAAAGPRKFALALAWRENALATKSCHPDSADAAADVTQADAAVARYGVPMGGLP